jgi:protein-S-isoprenylcysteine O-methyltransferase Ste14
MKKRIRIQGTLIILAVIITILLSRFVFPHWKAGFLDGLFDALGIILILFGFLIRILARGYKQDMSFSGKKLVKDGPYQLMQHPMYFGTLLIGIGIISVIFELWVIPLFLVTYCLIYIPQVKKEEETLSGRFSQEYKDYCKATPKYLPRLSGLLNPEKYISLRLSWIKKELSPLISVIVGILAMDTWQDMRLFGYKASLKELLKLILIILAFVILIIYLVKRKKKQ